MLLAIAMAAVAGLATVRCAIVACMGGLRQVGWFRCRFGIMAVGHRHAVIRGRHDAVLHGAARHGISRSIEDQANAEQQSKQDLQQVHGGVVGFAVLVRDDVGQG